MTTAAPGAPCLIESRLVSIQTATARPRRHQSRRRGSGVASDPDVTLFFANATSRTQQPMQFMDKEKAGVVLFAETHTSEEVLAKEIQHIDRVRTRATVASEAQRSDRFENGTFGR